MPRRSLYTSDLACVLTSPAAASDPLLSKLMEHDNALDALEAGGVFEGPGVYNVLANSTGITLVGDGVADNRVAYGQLFNAVIAAGGGTIYFPRGTYYMSIGPNPGNRSAIDIVNVPRMNVTLAGDGRRISQIIWGGDSGGGGACLHEFTNGTGGLTVRDLGFIQHNAIVNPDPVELHHAFSITTRLNGDNADYVFERCFFGCFKGDGINMVGTQDSLVDACHAPFSANIAAGSVGGVFTSPAQPQRLAVIFDAAWDGGNITITGTDLQNKPLTETFYARPDAIYTGMQYFKTVTSATKSATGISGVNAAIGFAYEVRDVVVDNCDFNGFVYSGTDPGYGFRACIVGQRLTSNIKVTNCTFRGSGDQLIDFEPTGHGSLNGWWIDKCTFITGNPTLANPIPALAVSFAGNGADPENHLTDAWFTNNLVIGRVKCGNGMTRCHVVGNTIIADANPDSTEPLLNFTGTLVGCSIERNNLITRPGFSGNAILKVTGDGAARFATSTEILSNHLEYYGSIGIQLENSQDCTCSGNVLYFRGTSGTHYGIECGNTITPVRNLEIHNNKIVGDAGGHVLARGVRISPGSTVATTRVSVIGNKGSGTGEGVSVTAPTGSATLANLTVHSNDLPLTIAAGVVIVVGGNPSGWRMLRGSVADPNGVAALDTETLGTLYTSSAGSAVYRKNTAGAAGWTTI